MLNKKLDTTVLITKAFTLRFEAHKMHEYSLSAGKKLNDTADRYYWWIASLSGWFLRFYLFFSPSLLSLFLLFCALASHMYLYVCPCSLCVLSLYCPSASAPWCVMVPEHNTVLWDVPVLLVQTGPGMTGCLRALKWGWKPNSGNQRLGPDESLGLHANTTGTDCCTVGYMLRMLLEFCIDAVSEGGHLCWLRVSN